MKNLFQALAVFLLTASSLQAQSIREIDSLLFNGFLPQAQVSCQMILQGNPSRHDVHFKLAQTYRMSSQYDLAFQQIKQAIKLDSSLAVYFEEQGRILEKNKEARKAIKSLRKAQQLEPNRFPTLNLLSKLLYKNDKFKDALQVFLKMDSLSPQNAFYKSMVAKSMIKSKKKRKSIPYLEEAINLAPQNIENYKILGYVYMFMDDYDKAQEILENGIKANPSNGMAYKNKATLYFAERHYYRCIPLYEKALFYGVPSSYTFNSIFDLGVSLYELKRYKKAKPYLYSSYKYDTLNYKPCEVLAKLYKAEKRVDSAYIFARKAKENFLPDIGMCSDIRNQYAEAALANKEYEKAIQEFKLLCIEHKGWKGLSYYEGKIAEVYKAQGNYDLALTYFEKSKESLKSNRYFDPRWEKYLKQQIADVKKEKFFRDE